MKTLSNTSQNKLEDPIEVALREETSHLVENLSAGWILFKQQISRWRGLTKSPLLVAVVVGALVYAIIKYLGSLSPSETEK